MFLNQEPMGSRTRDNGSICYIENMPSTLPNTVETFLGFRANAAVLWQKVRASLAPSNPPLLITRGGNGREVRERFVEVVEEI
jgi:hypothetical protein